MATTTMSDKTLAQKIAKTEKDITAIAKRRKAAEALLAKPDETTPELTEYLDYLTTVRDKRVAAGNYNPDAADASEPGEPVEGEPGEVPEPAAPDVNTDPAEPPAPEVNTDPAPPAAPSFAEACY